MCFSTLRYKLLFKRLVRLRFENEFWHYWVIHASYFSLVHIFLYNSICNIECLLHNILKINENATLVFSISFLYGLVNQSFVFIKQLYFTYSIKRLLFALIDCQYALFKIACSKTSNPTPCNVAHEWFVFLHRALLADWVDYSFPTSKCRYVVSISKYSKIKSLKIVNNFRAGGSGKI